MIFKAPRAKRLFFKKKNKLSVAKVFDLTQIQKIDEWLKEWLIALDIGMTIQYEVCFRKLENDALLSLIKHYKKVVSENIFQI